MSSMILKQAQEHENGAISLLSDPGIPGPIYGSGCLKQTYHVET